MDIINQRRNELNESVNIKYFCTFVKRLSAHVGHRYIIDEGCCVIIYGPWGPGPIASE